MAVAVAVAVAAVEGAEAVVEGVVVRRRVLGTRLSFLSMRHTTVAAGAAGATNECAADECAADECTAGEGVQTQTQTQLVLNFAAPAGAAEGALVRARGVWAYPPARGGDSAWRTHDNPLRVDVGAAADLVVLEHAPPPQACLERASTGASDGSPSKGVCRLWLQGVCPHAASACCFTHATNAREECVAARHRTGTVAARAEAVDPLDPYTTADKQPKAARFRLLAQWLVDTYGVAALRAGLGVLDVAGGGGALSAVLAAEHGVRSVVVDPRGADAGRFARGVLKRAAEREALAVASTRARADNADERASAASASATRPPRRRKTAARSHPLYSHVVEAFEYPSFSEDGGRAEDEASAARARTRATALVAKASVVVGLHADEATDAIVDCALAASRPFAVLPCCAFPTRYPPGSERAACATSLQLAAHLQRKHASIRRAHLPVEGRNVILYTLPHAS